MEVYLGLGSNLGDRKANLEKALQLLGERLQIEQVSSIYETEPVGHAEQPMFLNAVLPRRNRALVPLSSCFHLIKGIEATLGRVPSFTNGPRSIDVDILFYNDLCMETADLTIPHPKIKERAFVLIPLLEIAPQLVHPISGESIKELVNAIQGQEGVEKIDELGGF